MSKENKVQATKDKVRELFDRVTGKLNKVVPMMRLIDDEGRVKTEFVANGTTYEMLPITTFTIEKRHAYEVLIRMFATGKTPKEQWEDIQKQKAIIARMHRNSTIDKAISDLHKHTFMLEDSFKSVSNKFSIAYYVVSMFVVKKGSDPYKLPSHEETEEKINDWIAANIDPNDFFALARSTSKACEEILSGEDLSEK